MGDTRLGAGLPYWLCTLDDIPLVDTPRGDGHTRVPDVVSNVLEYT